MRASRYLLLGLLVAWPACGALAATRPRESARKPIAPRTFKLVDDRSGWTPIAPEPRSTTFVPSYSAAENAGAQGLIATVNFPGVAMGYTAYDYQHNGSMHHQVEVDPVTGRVHFSWMYSRYYVCDLCCGDRFVDYNYWDPGSDTFVACDIGGFAASPDNPKELSGCDLRGGYTTLDIASDGLAIVGFHEADSPGGTYHPTISRQTIAGQLWFEKINASNPAGEEQLWPVIDVSTFNDLDGSDVDTADVVHCVTADFENTNNYAYYRGIYTPNDTPAYQWSLPVMPFTGTTISAVVTEDPNSDKVTMVWAKPLDALSTSQVNNDVVYIESLVDGADWEAGNNLDPGGTINITEYISQSEGRAYIDLAAIYDNSGVLHIVWNERRTDGGLFYTNQCKLKHWSSTAGISTMAVAYYEPGARSGAWQLNLCKMSMGVGSPNATQMCDGETIDNYLYVTYTKFGGETQAEMEDYSAGGYNNGELYWSISRDAGNSWAVPVNLSNTKSPDCDTTFANRCASEHWSSIARLVNDQAHIQYIADQDAGGIPQPEGMWTINPVMYLCIDGDDLCPVIKPNAIVNLTGDPDCEYNTPPGISKTDETLTIENLGNATLTYNISVTDDGAGGGWLSVTPGSGGSLPPGAAADVHAVTMDATALAEGMYTGNITVTHSDASQPTFVFDIALFVFDEFICPDEVVLVTNNSASKANAQSNFLEVSNVASFGRENTLGGLWRPDTITYVTNVGQTDTIVYTSPLYDGSLAIGRLRGAPDNDTVVYRDIFRNTSPANPGFRGLTNLIVDTSAYGTGGGAVSASAVVTTVDSLIGIDVTYLFPQDADSSEFVIIKWRIYNRSANPLTDLLVGSIVDFDVYAQSYEKSGPQDPNYPPSLGGVISNNEGESNIFYNLVYQVGLDTDATGASTTKNPFSAGISAVQCAPGSGLTQDNPTFVYPLAGISEQYAYEQLAFSGFGESDSLSDLHAIITFDHDLDLNTPDDLGYYCATLVSSVVSEADLVNTTKKAWRYCFGWQVVPEEVIVDFEVGEVVTFKYVANGTHEDGIGGGCCGCQVSIVGSPPGITVDTPGECIGTITIDGNIASQGPITLRVQDNCSEYVDGYQMLIKSTCVCPEMGNVAPSPLPPATPDVNVLDVIAAIDFVFRSGAALYQDMECPQSRGDVAPIETCGDDAVNVLDVVALIDYVFRSGGAPGDPCDCGT